MDGLSIRMLKDLRASFVKCSYSSFCLPFLLIAKQNDRIPVKDIFRAAVNVSRLTHSLMRLVDSDYLSTYVKAVADSPSMNCNSMTTKALPLISCPDLSIAVGRGASSAQPEQAQLPPPDDPKTSEPKMQIRDDGEPLYSETGDGKDVTLTSAYDLSSRTMSQNWPSTRAPLTMGGEPHITSHAF